MKLDYLTIIFSDMKNRKFSSFLTFFAISLGILSIFVIMIISQSFQDSLNNEFNKLGKNRIIIQSKGSSMLNVRKGLDDNTYNLIKSRSYIENSFPIYFKLKGLVRYGNEFKRVNVNGVEMSKEFFNDFKIEIEKGRFPKENERFIAVVGPDFASDVFNKEVKVGSSIYINNVKFKIIGILKSVGNPEDDKNVYVSINDLRTVYGVKDELSMIYVTVKKNYDVKLASKNIEKFLENRIGKDTIDVRTLDQFMSTFNNVLNIIKLTLGGIAVISLIVGALGIINIMFVIITEKIKDIGIMKAIGARNSDIFFIYIFQSGSFGFLGGFLGIFFGVFILYFFEAFAHKVGYSFLKITLNFYTIVFLLMFSFFIGVVSGFIPSYKASKLNVVEALRK